MKMSKYVLCLLLLLCGSIYAGEKKEEQKVSTSPKDKTPLVLAEIFMEGIIQSSLRYSKVVSKDSLGPKIVLTKEFLDPPCDTSQTVRFTDSQWDTLQQIIREDIISPPLVITGLPLVGCQGEKQNHFSITDSSGRCIVGLLWECGLESKYETKIHRIKRYIERLHPNGYTFANDLHNQCE